MMRVTLPKAFVVLFVLFSSWASAAVQPFNSGYKLVRTIQLEGDGSWDYLIADSAARRLYVAHFDRVAVLDMDSGEVVGEIQDLHGVHGVAVIPQAGRGYASNGRSDSIAVFDLNTLAITAEIPAGKNPDAIVYDQVSGRVFAFNHSGGDVTVIRAIDGSSVATIEIGGELEYAVADGTGSIFVNVEDRNEIVRLDSRSLKVLSRWPIAPCEEPTGIAMDKVSRRLFSSCGNAMLIVVDADDGRVISQVRIGRGSDGARFDPGTRLIFTSNGEGTLSLIHEDSADDYRLSGTIPTQRGARTLEIDLATHHVFTATAKLGPVLETASGERPRPSIVLDSFVVLEFAP